MSNMSNMSKPVYNADKDELNEEIRRLEAEGYTCQSDEPRWNEFGQCWIVTMEKNDG